MISTKAKNIAPSSTFALAARVANLRAQGRKIIGFTLGEPDFDTPSFISEAATRAMWEGKTRYTATAGIPPLRQAICEKLKRENGLTYTPDQIVVSNGVKQALFNTLACCLNPGDEVIIIRPYWLTYPELVKICDGIPVFVDSLADVPAAITPKTKAIIVNTPNNPSGMVYTEAELKKFAKSLTTQYVISDEIYEYQTYGTVKHVSMAKLYKNTIVLNGFSKSYAMTGWRVGYSACAPELASAIDAFQSQTTANINTPAQYAALEALTCPQGEAFVKTMSLELGNRRKYMLERLATMPNITFNKPDGAFYVLLDVSKIGSAKDFAEGLLEKHGVAVIPCADFGLPNHIRLSYTLSMDEMKKGLDSMEKYLTLC